MQASHLEIQRRFGVIRGALLTYGIAAMTLLQSRGAPGAETSPLFFWGTVLQVVLIVINFLIRHLIRRGANADAASIISIVLELLIDAITVLLFTVGTFNSITLAPADL